MAVDVSMFSARSRSMLTASWEIAGLLEITWYAKLSRRRAAAELMAAVVVCYVQAQAKDRLDRMMLGCLTIIWE